MGHVASFDDFDSLLEAIDQERASADQQVRPFQAVIKAGDHFARAVAGMNDDEPLVIYGEVIESKSQEDREHYAQPHMQHFRFSKCFSQLCPTGELGDTHVSTMIPISPTQFALAKERGWPSDSSTVTLILNLS